MIQTSVNRYLQLLDLYNKLDVDSKEAESLALQIDEIWQTLTDADKDEIQSKLQVSE